MSVDIHWDTITSGSDGEALGEKIRDFIHDKFQEITLPRFINSVHVHTFELGSVCPVIEIKDVCDPLPDFYEDDESEDDQECDRKDDRPLRSSIPSTQINRDRLQMLQDQILHNQGAADADHGRRRGQRNDSYRASVTGQPHGVPEHLTSLFPRSGTPGIPGGTSNLGYFNLPLGGLSGTQTPLAAVASGTTFPPTGWSHDLHNAATFHHGPPGLAAPFQEGLQPSNQRQAPGSPTRPSTANTDLGTSFSPASPASLLNSFQPAEKVSDDLTLDDDSSPASAAAAAAAAAAATPRLQPSQPSDIQVVARVKYAGDVRMTLTAEILLDYPMPSFVGIPLQLSITGITFDGVAILAYIKKRMYFCFLSPEDAEALVGDQLVEEPDDDDQPESDKKGNNNNNSSNEGRKKKKKNSLGGLLEEIRVESEIGRKETGKQVLKNVGKVEKFVLEQIRRIFEEEFVFPSFWTFLV